mgnify:CR=1 FL=1
MNKKLHEYELLVLGEQEDNDENTIAPRKFYFRDKIAQKHNEQYAFYDTPRRLTKVKGGKVIEKPEWWSGTQDTLRKIEKNHKS